MNLEQEWNERKAIHLRMLQLQEESKAIRTEYEKLFNRLRELDSLNMEADNSHEEIYEQKVELGLEPTNAEGADIFSKIDEIRRSIRGQYYDVSTEEKEITRKSEEEAAIVMERRPRSRSKKITAAELLSVPPIKKNPQYKDYLILSNLKNKKKMRTAEVKRLLTENEIDVKNTTVILKILMDRYPEVTKVGHGIYEWIEQ
ncbi:hypothetical protein [Bacillus sp. FJAT-49736]|uniref:Rok-like winged helix domain-containing protein n=1 Tax=Bacillus sp. FJAT-49736 TaxID=2833582 RepID=UPI001BC8D7A8|nr:hypothetical protein [Bacillus sp. FJAT-49736]MBS4175623.1 hypothetical protein [Bacillus sp. FJAT-49736]